MSVQFRWKPTKYLALALDPLHIGTGGERIGRVDLTVVREPATNVPKIPGTSISGAAKFFLDLSLIENGVKTCSCASSNGSDEKKGHGAPGRDKDFASCPVCYAFGYTPPSDKNEDQNGTSAQGILQFTDAQLIAFPVHSMVGPVWITTMPRLQEVFNVGNGNDLTGDSIIIPSDSTIGATDRLNLGWVILPAMKLKNDDNGSVTIGTPDCDGSILPCLQRLVVLPEWLFSHIVNDNMEVRTSVSIDPETGAGKDGALFTYEAVPRGSIFGFTIVENDYRKMWANVEWAGKPNDATSMLRTHAFPGIAAVGLGGMTTRGFGRLDITEYPGVPVSPETHREVTNG